MGGDARKKKKAKKASRRRWPQVRPYQRKIPEARHSPWARSTVRRTLGTREIGGEKFEPVSVNLQTAQGGIVRVTKAEANARATALRRIGYKSRVVKVAGPSYFNRSGRWMTLKGPRRLALLREQNKRE